jgi:glycosyltransferase involved in cell wall biosynthesis
MKNDTIIDRQTDIAVIVPVYNPGIRKLKACIRSILQQSYKNFICVLVDDGSSDGSDELCDFYAAKDKRICVIHQKNSGSIEARKAGTYSKEAQSCKYITFVDADDTMPRYALEHMREMAERYDAELVCGEFIQKWKMFCLPSSFVPDCFAGNSIGIYEDEEIVKQLYISCFGINNFPINIYAKLYAAPLISEAMNCPKVVEFMGDDLNIMLNIIPLCKKIITMPEVVYYYRIGGFTSRFMPYMLEDFLALYQYKEKMAARYPMPYDVAKLMNIELVNIVKSYLLMCAKAGRYSAGQLNDEIQKIVKNPIIRNAAENADNAGLAEYIRKSQNDLIANNIWQTVKKDKWKDRLKRILYSV